MNGSPSTQYIISLTLLSRDIYSSDAYKNQILIILYNIYIQVDRNSAVENFVVRKTVMTIIIIRQKPREHRDVVKQVVAAVPSRQSDDDGSYILLLIIKNWPPPRDRFVKYSRHNSSRMSSFRSSLNTRTRTYIFIYKKLPSNKY